MECSVWLQWWALVSFSLNLRNRSIKVCERTIVCILTQFSAIRSTKVSDITFTFITVEFFWWWHGGSNSIHTIMSIQNACATWAQKTLIFWTVAEQRNTLGRFASVGLDIEANDLVFSISAGAWVHFCTRVKLNCLRFSDCIAQNKEIDWLEVEYSDDHQVELTFRRIASLLYRNSKIC